MLGHGLEVYLLDTSAASAAWDHGSRAYMFARPRLLQLDQDRIYICSITIAEIEYGLKTAHYLDSGRQQLVRQEMSGYKVLSVNRHTAQQYSDIRAVLFDRYAPRSHRQKRTKYIEDLCEATTGKKLGIQENDLWIVSVAVQHNLLFITRDQRGSMKKIVEAANYSLRTQYWP